MNVFFFFSKKALLSYVIKKKNSMFVHIAWKYNKFLLLIHFGLYKFKIEYICNY